MPFAPEMLERRMEKVDKGAGAAHLPQSRPYLARISP